MRTPSFGQQCAIRLYEEDRIQKGYREIECTIKKMRGAARNVSAIIVDLGFLEQIQQLLYGSRKMFEGAAYDYIKSS